MRRWLWFAVATVIAAAGSCAVLRTLDEQAPSDARGTRSPEAATALASDPHRATPREHAQATAAKGGRNGGDHRPARAQTPGPKLGDSLDPGRQSNARAVYDAALEQIDRLDPSETGKAQRIFLRGSGALERLEDELAEDDELGRLEHRRQTDALRSAMHRFERP